MSTAGENYSDISKCMKFLIGKLLYEEIPFTMDTNNDAIIISSSLKDMNSNRSLWSVTEIPEINEIQFLAGKEVIQFSNLFENANNIYECIRVALNK